MEQDQGASAEEADRAATPSEPSQSSVVSGIAGIPCAFTPGPWRVDAKPAGQFDIVAGPDYFSRTFVAFAGCGDGVPSEANARLIAAAPELYEALNAVDDYYSGRAPFDFHRLPDDQRANEAFDAWHTIADKMRVALRKARGQ